MNPKELEDLKTDFVAVVADSIARKLHLTPEEQEKVVLATRIEFECIIEPILK